MEIEGKMDVSALGPIVVEPLLYCQSAQGKRAIVRLGCKGPRLVRLRSA